MLPSAEDQNRNHVQQPPMELKRSRDDPDHKDVAQDDRLTEFEPPNFEYHRSGPRRSRSLPPQPLQPELPKLPLSTHPESASPDCDASSRDLLKADSQAPEAPIQAELKLQLSSKSPQRTLNRADPSPDTNQSPSPRVNKQRQISPPRPVTSWVEHWIDSDCPTISAQQAAEATDILLPAEPTGHDQMSLPVGTSQMSATSGQISTKNCMFRRTLMAHKMNIDEIGDRIPPDVQELVDRHFRVTRESPRLEVEQMKNIQKLIEDNWDASELVLSKMLAEPLLPVIPRGAVEGRDMRWNVRATPRKPGYWKSIPAPKPDVFIGFPAGGRSSWDTNELNVAEHPVMQPYSQPTSENLFPSYLREAKSEAKGGTIYAAASQLASAGAHRVNSWLWVLDLLEPNRKRSSVDAVVFSDAVNQREASAYVHYYDPMEDIYWMSCIDQFLFRNLNDIQRFRDHAENAMDWLLGPQQQMIRDALQRLGPVAKSWKAGRTASVVSDTNPSEECDEGSRRGEKSRRLE